MDEGQLEEQPGILQSGRFPSMLCAATVEQGLWLIQGELDGKYLVPSQFLERLDPGISIDEDKAVRADFHHRDGGLLSGLSHGGHQQGESTGVDDMQMAVIEQNLMVLDKCIGGTEFSRCFHGLPTHLE